MEEKILLAESGYINNIKYSTPPADDNRVLFRRSVSPLITIDWRNVLPAPPLNDSTITRDELQYISNETHNRTKLDIDLVQIVDREPLELFYPLMKKYDISFPHATFDKAWDIFNPIVIKLKWQYLRPRPYRLAEVFNIPIDLITTDTHHTPAYPSGHTAYAALAASVLSAIYPSYSKAFYGVANVVGHARIKQGVHYPSDNDTAMIIAGAIWEDIRYSLL